MFANRTVCGLVVPCVALYIVVVVAIVAYGAVLRATKARDILATPIYNHPLLPDVDGWSVSHFVFFGLLGLMYPDRHLQFLTVGALWEVVETLLGQNRVEVSGKRLQLVGDQGSDGVSTGKDDAYWYGKSSDITIDIAGYSIGSALAKKYWPEPAPQCADRRYPQ